MCHADDWGTQQYEHAIICNYSFDNLDLPAVNTEGETPSEYA